MLPKGFYLVLVYKKVRGIRTMHSPTYSKISFSFPPLLPTAESQPTPNITFNFGQGYLLSYKCEGSHTRRLGAYGITRTSLHRY
ncbi:hypothetical protein Hdeb2414_s0012g00396111 [Helianthus debilis subsp. tardiflorus]